MATETPHILVITGTLLFDLFVLAALICFISYLLWRITAETKLNEAKQKEIEQLKAVNYQYHLEIAQVINYFVTSISQQQTIDNMLWDIARNCISKLHFEDCVIYLYDDERKTFVQKAAWGPKTAEDNNIINPIEIPIGFGIVGSVGRNQIAEIINDTSLDRRYIIDDQKRSSEITVPIIHKGKVIGIIDSENSAKNFYTERHLQILTTIATFCADKIDKIQVEQQTKEREDMLNKLNKDLATSQLTSLRSQMNPHFIFNALNSIQQFILMGEVKEAIKYLSKFSKLQREVLNNCEQNFITLEAEIEMITLYLQLEQLRFDKNFSYNITLGETISPSEIKIPSMMLQPFVENAIWHGLIPKEGPKQININFALVPEDLICCTIEDNGIGREASAKRKSLSGYNNHTSKGFSLVTERLYILRKHYQQTFDLEVGDIRDPEGNVSGTSVKLKLHVNV
ncbi:histidine kinase [Danxiaibacter flavus]|uniref:Histidine kinase n=1 Tax=Danxiaibacter flavus TaxID=3049108 RepID=A0ABV3ZFI8_9BACT|nr:histidine kinase [Chitinophagaceae bacterium DXS]